MRIVLEGYRVFSTTVRTKFCKDLVAFPKILTSFLLTIIISVLGCASNTPEITVSAASNLIPAFEEIGQVFEAETNIKVVYNFGASGTLTQQIEQGAPVDVFASANADYITRLISGSYIDPQSERIYALGRLVIWSHNSTDLPPSLEALTQPSIQRIAIANPTHAPYGIITKRILEDRGLWSSLRPKLIMGDNVRQAFTYAETGDVTVAILPLSLVIQEEKGAYTLIPSNQHPPIIQGMGIIQQSSHKLEAQQFVDFVLSTQGQAILAKYGYESTQTITSE